jgi:hypothetical protein
VARNEDYIASAEDVQKRLVEAGAKVLGEGFPPRRQLEEDEKAAYNQGYLDALALAIYYINQV